MTTGSQTPEGKLPTEEEEYQKPEENALRASRVTAAYLIIARYNLDKELAVNAAGEHVTARDTARELFPQKNTKGLQNLPGVRTCHTFRSPFFDRLPDDFFYREDKQQELLTQSAIAALKQKAAEAALAGEATGELNGGNPRKADALRIGWIAIIDADAYPSFVKRMGGENSAFSRVFDMEVIELNDDRTTNDIYQLMTPRSWN